MLQDNNVSRIDSPELFIGIELQAILVQRPYFVVLILEINSAVIILKGPHEWQAVGIDLRSLRTELRIRASCGIARTILAKNDRIVFFAAGNARIKSIENTIIIRIETRFFVFPGCIGEQVQIFACSVFIGATCHIKTGR